MRGKPDIVKMLGREEKLGKLQGRLQNKYEKLKMSEESFENVSDETVGSVEDDDRKKRVTVDDTAGYDKLNEKLRESEERLKMILDNLRVGVAIIDAETHKIIDVNPMAIKMFGAPKEKIVGHICHQFICPDEKGKCPITDLGQKIDNSERVLITADGDEISVLKTVIPIALNGRQCLIDSFIDIADLKNAEEALRESEKIFRAISTSAQDGIIMIDNDGKVSYWNEASERMFGYKHDEIVGKNLHMTLAPQSFHEAHKKGFSKFKDTGKGAAVGKTLELSALKKDGTEFPIELSMSSVKIKGKWNAIGIVRDITDRKKAEKETIKQRDRAQRYLDIAGVMLVAVNTEGNVTLINKKGCEVLGYDAGEIVGKNWFDNFVPKRTKGVILSVSKQLLDGEVEPAEYFENPILTKNGEERLIAWHNTVLKDEKGKIIGHLSSGEDITGRKKVEEKIKQQNIQLQRLNRIKSEFLNITSHELRTPMTAMKGYMQMLLNQRLGGLTDEQQKVLDIVLQNTNRLDNLIQDILDTSLLESGSMKLSPEKTDMNQLMKEIAETMQPSANIKGLTINLDRDEGIPELVIDQERIKQVMMNLVNNAIKFSADGSIINVRAKKQKENVLVEIQDYGKGIPKDKQKKVFEMFYQVDSGMDRSFGGTGLGLSISRGIVLGHGGKIWVESEKGKGSIFRFMLPIKPFQVVEGTLEKIDMFNVETDKEKSRGE